MPKTETRQAIQDRVGDLLTNLNGEHQLRELCRHLNYNHCNTQLSSRHWRSATVAKLVENRQIEEPALLASGGARDDFHVIYTRLRSNNLFKGHERLIVSQLLQDHPYALFVFSNSEQDRWHFLNVKYYREQGHHSRIFRRIAIGGHNRLHTAAKRLSMLDLENLDGAAPLDIQSIHDQAFDVEAVTLAFFQSYKQIFDDLQKDLLRQTGNKNRRWAHDYVLQLLNRIMFLYFIQRKEWLGEETEFLRTFWQSYDCRQNRDLFFDRWLKILFFESFNRPFHHRNGKLAHLPPKICAAVKQAPYLNGGLFKPNELDDTDQRQFIVTDKMFEQVFKFLEQHNFTIAEDSPLDQEVAVDPEMIGRVYESLVNVSVEAEEQGDAGIFYTPRTEIDLMCRLALVDNFANHLGQDQKSLFYETIFALEEDEKEAADQKLASAHLWPNFAAHLRQLTVLDPACGSGSFLVGMLHILNDLQGRANSQLKQDESEFDRKKRIIAENLYGVEVMKWATHVTELRLWLTLIVDAPFSLAELHGRDEPLLPHFTFRVRQGDSLVQEVGEINLGHKRAAYEIPKEIRAQIDDLKAEKLKFYHNDPRRKFASEKEAKKFERQLFLTILEKRQEAAQNEIKRLQHKIAGPSSQQLRLDGSVESQPYQMNLLAAEWQKQVETLKAELDKIARDRIALENNDSDYFVWDIAFVEILASEKQGFDIVIGNPPYVRQENISNPSLARDAITKENKQAYKAKLANSVYQAFPQFFGYKPATGHVAYKLDGKSDLYVYFYFHALSLLNPKGSFCFITSNSWLDVGYGAELQEFLLKYCHVKMVLDNQVQRSFYQADVNTVIALFSPPDESREWGLEQTARFVMFKHPFENVLSSSVFQEIAATNERRTTPTFRIHPISQRAILAAGCEVQNADGKGQRTKNKTHGSNKVQGPLIKIERYVGDKWGGKYLRAPDIYWTILKKGKGKLVRLGDIAEVRFGCHTGLNEFYYLDRQKVKEFEIEEEFLRPAITDPEQVGRLRFSQSSIDTTLFVCHVSEIDLKRSGKNGALKWIIWGKKQKSKAGQKRAAGIPWPRVASLRDRKPYWYSIPLSKVREALLFLPYRTRKIFYVALADSPLVSHVCFHNVKPHNPNILQSIHAYLNTTLAYCLREMDGRKYGGGGGPLESATIDWSNLLVPTVIPATVIQALESLAKREPISIHQEIVQADRRALDDIIFDVIDLSQGEREAVYEAMIDLVESRLKKAESFNPNNRQEHEDDEEMETTDA